MWVRIAIGAGAGAIVGGVLGYLGKRRSGASPLTANPVRGAFFGAVLGALMGLSFGTPYDTRGPRVPAWRQPPATYPTDLERHSEPEPEPE